MGSRLFVPIEKGNWPKRWRRQILPKSKDRYRQFFLFVKLTIEMQGLLVFNKQYQKLLITLSKNFFFLNKALKFKTFFVENDLFS